MSAVSQYSWSRIYGSMGALQHLIDRTDVSPWSFSHFGRFVAEYETRFEREYGYFRPIVKEVVEKYLFTISKMLSRTSISW